MAVERNVPVSGWRRWCGPSAIVALGVFLAGRMALEPVRTLPQFDGKGMDPYGAVETFRLRLDPKPFSVALFGSSVSIWGVLSERVAEGLGLPNEQVRKLAVVGGTPFDHWKLIERNPEEFSESRVALIELNPRMMHPDMESDQRIRFTLSQHATWSERETLHRRHERYFQRAEMALPVISVRRSLRSAFLNCVQPVHGTRVYPKPDARLFPFIGWHVAEGAAPYFRDIIPAHTAARRLVANWQCSRFQDQCLRKTLAFFREKGVRVILYQLPVHPDVAAQIRSDPKYAAGYAKYLAYVETLGVPPEHRIQHVDIADSGVPLRGMRDLTHFNEIGANIYSQWLGAHLRAMLQVGSGSPPE
jgi:hypothetical protein